MKTKNDYSLAATILAIGIAVSLMLWAGNVHAEDAPKYHIQGAVVKLVAGTPKVLATATYTPEGQKLEFDTKEACDEFRTTDPRHVSATAKMVAQVESVYGEGAEFLTICTAAQVEPGEKV